MIKVSTSILNANNYETCIKKLNNSTTDYIHIDVMDNKFVPNYKFSPDEIITLSKISTKPLDIHLMVENPIEYLKYLNNPNINSITFHLEINQNIKEIIEEIRKKRCQVGLAIKPNTDLNLINKYLNIIDKIIVMSVEPGFGGQQFIPNTINRIKEIKKNNNHIIIEVDGGINQENIKNLKGIIDIAVSGSYIINEQDYNKAINNLKI